MKIATVRFDQKFIGTFDDYADALDVVKEHSPHFEKVATVESRGEGSVDIFVCRPHGVVNYAYASITTTDSK